MFFPKTKVCDICGRPFTQTIEGVATCMQCLIKPRNFRDPVPKKKEEEPMAASSLVAEKICVDCQQPYTPTGNRQERCLKCRKEHAQAYQREHSSRNAPPRKYHATHAVSVPEPLVHAALPVPAPAKAIDDLQRIMAAFGTTEVSFKIGSMRITAVPERS